MNHEILCLIPCVMTILVAITTQKIALALFSGIVSGALVYVRFSLLDWFWESFSLIKESFADVQRLEIALFVIVIGALLELISASGAYLKFAEKISGYLDTPRKTRVSTWILGLLLFFDDYANLLITGVSMKSIFQKHKVSLAMLAYLVDIGATFVSVMLISTWAAFEISLMVDASGTIGMKKTGMELFISALPYHVYTYFGIFLTFLVAWSGKWFGYRLENQKIEEEIQEENTTSGKNARFMHVFVPLFSFVFCSIAGLFISGYIKLKSSGAEVVSPITILGEAPTTDVLLGAAVFSFVLGIFLLRKDRVLPDAKSYVQSIKVGISKMVSVALVIILSKGLCLISEKLGTGNYISEFVTRFLTPGLVPFLVFAIAVVMTVATGFSWSTMTILMPIGYQLAVKTGNPEFVPVVTGAVICGSIAGAQLVPYSDTSVMTAVGCSITPIYHAKTQFFQVFGVILVSCVAYVCIGYGYTLLACLGGPLLLLGFHAMFAKSRKRYSNEIR